MNLQGLDLTGAENARVPKWEKSRVSPVPDFSLDSASPRKALEAPSGGPTGGLSARARDAGGKALPAPQAESTRVEGCSSVRFARASVRRDGEACHDEPGARHLTRSGSGGGLVGGKTVDEVNHGLARIRGNGTSTIADRSRSARSRKGFWYRTIEQIALATRFQ